MEMLNEIPHIIGYGVSKRHATTTRESNSPLLIVSFPHHAQNGKEEVQNVEVKSHGSPDVLIIRESLDQIVSVIDNVPREDDRADAPINSN